ncbi:2'-5' RNA ligase family protein [Mobiluncus mulieris]|nr:2'-5' RNA ligase family protein [Mobiluncus mulieris]
MPVIPANATMAGMLGVMYLAPREPGQVYLGMIIPLPEPYASELAKITKTHGVPPHITIVEPRPVNPEDVPLVRAEAERLCADFSPFVISFGNIGDFRPVSPVVYIEVQRGFETCKELAKRLRFGPLAGEARFPYYPHITLGTNVTDADLDYVARLCRRSHGYFMVEGIDLDLVEPEEIKPVTVLQLGGAIRTAEIPLADGIAALDAQGQIIPGSVANPEVPRNSA